MENNDVVIINLDRPRKVRFGHKALKTLCAMLGVSFDDLDKVLSKTSPETIEQIMYCGLLSDAKENGEPLKLEHMEDLLDKADSYTEIVEKMTMAISMAFPNNQGTANNPKR